MTPRLRGAADDKGRIEKDFARALIFCGTGMGIHIAASKCPGVHAGVVESVPAAFRAITGNGVNVLAMGAFYVTPELGKQCADAFLYNDFGSGWAWWPDFDKFHQIAIDKLNAFRIFTLGAVVKMSENRFLVIPDGVMRDMVWFALSILRYRGYVIYYGIMKSRGKTCWAIVSIATLFALSGLCGDSFGPLTPSAEPYERAYIWPEGKMPDAQPHQIAAKTGEKNAPGFKADDFRRPYLDWYAPNPDCKTDLCVITVSGGGFRSCCDAARLQPAIDRFVKAGITVADLTYRTPRPKGLPIHQSAWEDLQRAVRVVRSQAAKRGFNPAKIGATGISAGAKAVLLVATSSLTPAYAPIDEIDALPCKLLFALPQAPAYVLTDGAGTPNTRDGDAPDVQLVPELKFDAKTCPMCFFQGGIDNYSPFGSTQIYRQLRRMKIPAELHLFADRWHGFHGNMNRGDDGTGWDHWFHRAEEFIRQMNFDGRLGEEVKLMARFPDDAARGACEKEEIWPADKMPPGYTNQCTPFIEWHFPGELKTKAVQIIFSGGGYHWNKPEGMEVTPARRYLNAKGMTVVTLKYRSPRPAGGLAKHTSAWQDLQRAIRIVRSKAAQKGLDPARIGIMGGSAGGHLALMGATSSRHRCYWPIDEIDKVPCAVQWAVAIYPAYSLTDGVDCKNVHGGNDDGDRLVPEFSFDLDTCPVLFIHGDADGYSAMASVKAWEQLRRMGIQGELHTLASRGHCFQNTAAPGTGSDTYLDRIWEFLNHKGFSRKDI